MELRKHGARVARLQELDGDLQALRADMKQVVQELNAVLGRDAVRGQAYPHGSGAAACRARLHLVGGLLAVRYEVGSRDEGNLTTRSQLVEGNGGGRWAVAVEELKKPQLLILDRRRRILNHEYRTRFAERRSLRRLHREEQALRSIVV